MSNIIPLNQAQNAQLPDFMRHSTIDQQLAASVAIPRISLAGGVISVKRGQEIVATFGPAVPILIVGTMAADGRVYYAGEYDPTGGENQPPICWSSNGLAPDPDAKQPQSPACANCQWNVKGSARNGKGKACAYIRNLAVAIINDPNPGTLYRFSAKGMTLFGQANNQLNKFNLKSLPNHLQARGLSLATTVLQMEVDPSMGVPGKVVFEPIGLADTDLLGLFYDLQASQREQRLVYRPEVAEMVQQITSLDFGRVWEALENRQDELTSVPEGAVPQQAQAPVAPQAPTAPVQPAPAQPVQQPAQQPVQQPMMAQPVPQQAQAPVTPQAPTAPVQPAPAQVPPVAPVQAPPAAPVQAAPSPTAEGDGQPPFEMAPQATPAEPVTEKKPAKKTRKRTTKAKKKEESAPQEQVAQAAPASAPAGAPAPAEKPADIMELADSISDLDVGF